VEQLLKHKQWLSSVTEYMTRFREFALSCELEEESLIRVRIFDNDLNFDIKREVSIPVPELVVDEAYHKVLGIEKYQKPIPRRETCSVVESRQFISLMACSSSYNSVVESRQFISLMACSSSYNFSICFTAQLYIQLVLLVNFVLLIKKKGQQNQVVWHHRWHVYGFPPFSFFLEKELRYFVTVI
jgi:hypothetical protein